MARAAGNLESCETYFHHSRGIPVFSRAYVILKKVPRLEESISHADAIHNMSAVEKEADQQLNKW